MQFFQFSETEYTEYLSDESRIKGHASSLSFPETEEEIAETLRTMRAKEIPVTIQGARTGLSGGAVPDGGHVLNLSRMNHVTSLRYLKNEDEFIIGIQPGYLLADLKKALRQKNIDIPNGSKSTKEAILLLKKSHNYFLPPDPTETLASIGGLASCNASGSCSFAYGSIRPYIARLSIVLADGSIHRFTRGDQVCKGYQCGCLLNDKLVSFNLPSPRLQGIKNSSGYFSSRDMDMVDLFIGSEGTLGVISEIELRLIPEPRRIWACACFFAEHENAMSFVHKMKDVRSTFKNTKLAALEYIDATALQLLEELRTELPDQDKIPPLDSAATCIYFELHGDCEAELKESMLRALELLEACNGDPAKALAATDTRELEVLKVMRHAVPEAANRWMQKKILRNPDITVICVDMAVFDDRLQDLMSMYRGDLARSGIRHVIYGHIGDNHIHCNLLPGNSEEFASGLKLYQQWAKTVASWGGTLSAEHGIGKQKSAMLKEFIAIEDYRKMQTIKSLFDPDNILNRKDIFFDE